MENIDYKEAMLLAQDSFYEYKNDEGYSVEQSLAAALEDCILMMRKDKIVYNAVIIVLSKISMKYSILPDYLYDRVLVILDGSPTEFDSNFVEEYNDMINDIIIVFKEKNFKIINDEIYKARIDMLLSDNN